MIPISVTGEMMEAMIRHDWPGNVRELQNVLHRFRSLNRFDLVRGIPSVAAEITSAESPEEIRGSIQRRSAKPWIGSKRDYC